MENNKAEKTFNLRPISYTSFSRSPVDILIPFHGQYEKVTKLIESILLLTRSNPYQINLIDDCSPNPQFIKELGELPQVKTYRTPKQLGFGGALQYGYEKTSQPWVVILHSDCFIKDSQWLIEMGKSLLRLKNENVRLVSARTNNPGYGYDPNLKGKRENKLDKDIILKEGCLPLYCAMCHRLLFKYINGFIKNYPYHGYEDEELAFRMNRYGFRQAICGKSWVFHHGSSTIDALCKENPKIADEINDNRDKCLCDIQKLK